MSLASTETVADIWARTLKPSEGDLGPETARFFLGIELSESDKHRLHELSAKAREGSLNPQESGELDCYLELGWFLDTMKSKARLSLQPAR